MKNRVKVELGMQTLVHITHIYVDMGISHRLRKSTILQTWACSINMIIHINTFSDMTYALIGFSMHISHCILILSRHSMSQILNS